MNLSLQRVICYRDQTLLRQAMTTFAELSHRVSQTLRFLLQHFLGTRSQAIGVCRSLAFG